MCFYPEHLGMNYLLCRSVLCQFALILSLSLSLSVLFILLAKHIFEIFGTHQNRNLGGRGRFVRIAPGSFGPGYAEWLSGRQDQKWVVQVTYDMARHRMTWFCFQLVFVPCYLVGWWWINYIKNRAEIQPSVLLWKNPGALHSWPSWPNVRWVAWLNRNF